MQLPQYMPAAPAVIYAIFTPSSSLRGKKRCSVASSGGDDSSEPAIIATPLEASTITATGMTPVPPTVYPGRPKPWRKK